MKNREAARGVMRFNATVLKSLWRVKNMPTTASSAASKHIVDYRYDEQRDRLLAVMRNGQEVVANGPGMSVAERRLAAALKELAEAAAMKAGRRE